MYFKDDPELLFFSQMNLKIKNHSCEGAGESCGL